MSESLIKSILTEGFALVATSRTEKYFINSANYEELLDQVVDTIDAIRATNGTFVKVADEMYPISDYCIPAKLVDYVSSGRVYFNSEAVGRADHVVLFNSDAKPIAPERFNAFFRNFNANQGSDAPNLKLCERLEKVTHTLGDFKLTEDENGSLYHTGSRDASVGEESSQICGVPLLVDNKYVVEVRALSIEGLARWLFA